MPHELNLSLFSLNLKSLISWININYCSNILSEKLFISKAVLNNKYFKAPMAELVDATDSKSVELRFMSVRVGLGVPLSET